MNLKGLQKNNKNISTHPLTMLIIRAIVQLEQKRGVQREQKEQKSCMFQVLQGTSNLEFGNSKAADEKINWKNNDE